MDLDQRLDALQSRRLGVKKLQKSLDLASIIEASQRSLLTERYQQRTTNKAARYVLGAMEEVSPNYTKISLEQGQRIGSQLASRLPSNWNLEFALQGSVPLNVHIEGISDVDLLVVRTDYLDFDSRGPNAQSAVGSDRSIASVISELRSNSVEALKSAFPAALVDVSGAKSVGVTGGSLQRDIDVVPSIWWHTPEYQKFAHREQRGITVLDIKTFYSIRNLPFYYIYQINQKDKNSFGGAKKIIRLLKNLKADATDKESINLSSYDIASIVWHIDDGALITTPSSEILLLAVAKQVLQHLRSNKSEAMRLQTPDGLRTIVDSEEKFTGLQLLSLEVDRVAEEVAAEVNPLVKLYPSMSGDTVLNTLRKYEIAS
ncbi:MAG: hypothetical protein ACKO1J_09285 [Tagaea sp.]